MTFVRGARGTLPAAPQMRMMDVQCILGTPGELALRFCCCGTVDHGVHRGSRALYPYSLPRTMRRAKKPDQSVAPPAVDSFVGNKYVREFAWFSSNRATQFGQAFDGLTTCYEKGKVSSATVVDIEAQVRDID